MATPNELDLLDGIPDAEHDETSLLEGIPDSGAAPEPETHFPSGELPPGYRFDIPQQRTTGTSAKEAAQAFFPAISKSLTNPDKLEKPDYQNFPAGKQPPGFRYDVQPKNDMTEDAIAPITDLGSVGIRTLGAAAAEAGMTSASGGETDFYKALANPETGIGKPLRDAFAEVVSENIDKVKDEDRPYFNRVMHTLLAEAGATGYLLTTTLEDPLVIGSIGKAGVRALSKFTKEAAAATGSAAAKPMEAVAKYGYFKTIKPLRATLKRIPGGKKQFMDDAARYNLIGSSDHTIEHGEAQLKQAATELRNKLNEGDAAGKKVNVNRLIDEVVNDAMTNRSKSLIYGSEDEIADIANHFRGRAKFIQKEGNLDLLDAQDYKQWTGTESDWPEHARSQGWASTKKDDAVAEFAESLYSKVRQAIEDESPAGIRQLNQKISEIAPIVQAAKYRANVGGRNNFISLNNMIGLSAAAMGHAGAVIPLALEQASKTPGFWGLVSRIAKKMRGSGVLEPEADIISQMTKQGIPKEDIDAAMKVAKSGLTEEEMASIQMERRNTPDAAPAPTATAPRPASETGATTDAGRAQGIALHNRRIQATQYLKAYNGTDPTMKEVYDYLDALGDNPVPKPPTGPAAPTREFKGRREQRVMEGMRNLLKNGDPEWPTVTTQAKDAPESFVLGGETADGSTTYTRAKPRYSNMIRYKDGKGQVHDFRGDEIIHMDRDQPGAAPAPAPKPQEPTQGGPPQAQAAKDDFLDENGQPLFQGAATTEAPPIPAQAPRQPVQTLTRRQELAQMHGLEENHPALKHIEQTEKQLAETEKIAHTDALTDLPNQRAHIKALEDPTMIGHASADVGRFKRFNTLYGHNGGDDVIRGIAEEAKRVTAETGVRIFRRGGDEFVALAENEEKAANAMKLLQERLAKRKIEAYDPATQKVIAIKEQVELHYGQGTGKGKEGYANADANLDLKRKAHDAQRKTAEGDRERRTASRERRSSDQEYAGRDLRRVAGPAAEGQKPPVPPRPGVKPEAGNGPELFQSASEAGVKSDDAATLATAKKEWEKKGTKSPFFMRWFGGSKVVDEKGNPLPVYHGTNQNFDRFLKKRLGQNTASASSRGGFFFTESSSEAGDYANMSARRQVLNAVEVERESERLLKAMDRANSKGDFDQYEKLTQELEKLEADSKSGGGANVIPAYLTVKNPIIFDMKGKDLHDMIAIIKEAKNKGYDGVKLENVYDPVANRDDLKETIQWVVFDPSQIKSATGNRGTFSPESPNILYQTETAPKPEKAPTFYSHLRKTIEAKMPNAAPPDQIRGILKGAGVKEDEIKWTDLEDFLEGKQKVTKADLLAHLDEHGYKLEETTLADQAKIPVDIKKAAYKAINDMDDLGFDNEQQALRAVVNHADYADRWNVDKAHIPALDAYRKAAKESAAIPKFSEYQTPGGKPGTYRETLIRLPRQDTNKEVLAYAKKHNIRDINEAFEKFRKTEGRYPNANPGPLKDFTGGHFGEHPNTAVHIRHNEREIPAITKTPAELKEIGERLAQAVSKRSKSGHIAKPESLGNGAIEVGIKDGAVTPEEAAAYAESRGFRNLEDLNLPKTKQRVLHIEEMQDDWTKAAHRARNNEIDRVAEEKDISKEEAAKLVSPDFGYSKQKLELKPGYTAIRFKGLNRIINEDPNKQINVALWTEQNVKDIGGKSLDDWIIVDREHNPVVEIAFRGDMSRERAVEEFAASAADAGGMDDMFVDPGGVPDRPFKKNWHELGLRRMIRYAAEHGYDRLSWTPAKEQIERYPAALRQVADHIEWSKSDVVDMRGKPVYGHKEFHVNKNGNEVLRGRINENGTILDASRDGVNGKKLDEVFGKNMATQIAEKESGEIKGQDFTVGGKGFVDLYDRMIPQYLEKYGKKWGAKVESVEIKTGEGKLTAPTVKPFTKSDWDGLEGAEPFISGDEPLIGEANVSIDGKNAGVSIVLDGRGVSIIDPEDGTEFYMGAHDLYGTPWATAEAAEKALKMWWTDKNSKMWSRLKGRVGAGQKIAPPKLEASQTVQSIPITPAMRKSVMEEGQPMFQKPGTAKTSGPKGSFQQKGDKSVITLFKGKADVTTVLHEVAHKWRRDALETLPDDAAGRVLRWTGQSEWNTAAEEKWARAGERYFYDGKSPRKDLDPAFEHLKNRFREVYKELPPEMKDDLPEEIRIVYDNIFLRNMKADPERVTNLLSAIKRAQPTVAARLLAKLKTEFTDKKDTAK